MLARRSSRSPLPLLLALLVAAHLCGGSEGMHRENGDGTTLREAVDAARKSGKKAWGSVLSHAVVRSLDNVCKYPKFPPVLHRLPHYSYQRDHEDELRQDPCLSPCTECPATGLTMNANVADRADRLCLCKPSYLAATKSGDHRVPLDTIPHEFVLAGAAFQFKPVQDAVARFFFRVVRFVHDTYKDQVMTRQRSTGGETRSKWDEFDVEDGRPLIKAKLTTHLDDPFEWMEEVSHQDGRGIDKDTSKVLWQSVAALMKDPQYADKHTKHILQEDFIQLPQVQRLNIREILSMCYLITKYAGKQWMPRVLDEMARRFVHALTHPGTATEEGIGNVQHLDIFAIAQKRALANEFCTLTQHTASPCAFKPGTQGAPYFIHLENDMSSPHDGWFEWRFCDGADGTHNQRSGFNQPRGTFPMESHTHVTAQMLEAIGAPLSAAERANLGGKYTDDTAPLTALESGINWFVQEDCDCDPDTCQPADPAKQKCEGGFNRIAAQMGGRSVAGPSGTTAKMMLYAVFMAMSREDLYLLRLGFIAWMVPVEDHSLLEILMAAEDVGIPHPHSSLMHTAEGLLPACSPHLNGFAKLLKDVETSTGVVNPRTSCRPGGE